MISTTPDGLWQELDAGIQRRQLHAETLSDQIRRFVGPEFNKGDAPVGDEYDPINQALMLTGTVLPSVAYSNPRVRVGTRRIGSVQRQDAEALGLALNRWIVETDLATTLEQCATDFLFAWSVAHVTRARRPGEGEHTDPLYWAQVERLPQERVAWDPKCYSWATKRWASHSYTKDHADLVELAKADQALDEDEREGWNLDVIKKLEPGKVGTGTSDRLDERDTDANVDRQEVEIHEVWIPEVTLPWVEAKAKEAGKSPADLGYHGTIYYLVRYRDAQGRDRSGRFTSKPLADKTAFVRAPQPFFGPRTGPYTLFSAYYVPSESVPLGPLTAQEAQVRGVNEIARSAHDSARDYKRVMAVDEDTQDGFGRRVQQTLHDNFVGVQLPEDGDVRKAIMPLEINGITEQQLTQLGLEKGWLDEVSGLSEAQRGKVTGGTATENAIAASASSQRVEWLVEKFERGVKDLLTSVAWYMWTDDEVVQPIGASASEERGARSLIFLGGNPDQEQINRVRERYPQADIPDAPEGPQDSLGATFYDLELEIEPYSMGRASEGARRAQGAFMVEFATGIAPMLPQLKLVGVNVEEFLETLGDQLAMPRLGRLIDYQQLDAYASQMAQMQVQPTEDPRANTSRLKSTTGGMLPHAGTGKPGQDVPGGLNSTSQKEGNRSGSMAAQAAG